MAGIAGPGLHDKRNLVKQRLTPHRERVEPDPPALLPQALQVLQGWLTDKGKQAGDADDTPARTALQHAPDWGWCGQLLWADDTPAAWLLAEPLAPGLHVLRFAKSLARFKGVAAYGFSEHASRHAVQWLNFEQDLGLPNFRRTKESYRPAARLHKWRATWLAHSTLSPCGHEAAPRTKRHLADKRPANTTCRVAPSLACCRRTPGCTAGSVAATCSKPLGQRTCRVASIGR